MRSRLVVAVCLVAASARADLVTLRQGPPVRGTVVSVDEKSLTIKTDSQLRVIDRSAVRKVEFGDVLVTGIRGREYVNADYRVRLAAPPEWVYRTEPGMDVTAVKGNVFLGMKGIALADAPEDAVIRGSIGGMKATVQGASFGEPQPTTWAGSSAKKVSVKSKDVEGFVLYPQIPGHVVMMLFIARGPGPHSEELARAASDWEKGFRIVGE